MNLKVIGTGLGRTGTMSLKKALEHFPEYGKCFHMVELIFKVQDGWQPLCDFLGKNVPNIPFPRTHKKNKFNQNMDKLMNEGVFITE